MVSRVELLRDLDRANGWLLAVDGVPQSYVDLNDPTHLEFEYIRLMADVLDTVTPVGAVLDVVHLGGGGCSLPRYIAATRPGSRQAVLEADEEVIRVGCDRLGLADVPGLDVRLTDARAGLVRCLDGTADVLVVDVFDGPEVPAHLLTVEALADAARVLRDGGLLLANVADSTPFDFARRAVAAAASVFPHAGMLADPGVLRGRRFGNLVVLGSRRPLPEGDLRRMAARAVPPVRLVCDTDLTSFVADAEPSSDVAPASAPAPPDWRIGG